ncbi:MAG: class I tRNA ligase family protein [Chloroflexota bacterium]
METSTSPHDVPANQFFTIEVKRLSTSRNWAVWLPDFLSRYDPDPLRYLLSINMPETSDTNFSWQEFVRRNNDELVATYGNLAHRVLTFVYRNFDGCVPTYDDMGVSETEAALIDAQGNDLINLSTALFREMDESLSRCHFRQALKTAMGVAQATNRYLDEKSPWKVIKEDRQSAATSLYVALVLISHLKTMLYPFLPFSSQRLHEFLGFEGRVSDNRYELQAPLPGRKLLSPEPLFTKLDEKLVAEETSRLGHVECQ